MKTSLLVLVLLGCSSQSFPADAVAADGAVPEQQDGVLLDGGDNPGDATLVALHPGEDAGADAAPVVDAGDLDGAQEPVDGGAQPMDWTVLVGKWKQTRTYLLNCSNNPPSGSLQTVSMNDIEVKSDFSVFLSTGALWLNPGVFVDDVWYPESINPSGGVAYELRVEGEQLVGSHKQDCGGVPGGHLELVWDRLPL